MPSEYPVPVTSLLAYGARDTTGYTLSSSTVDTTASVTFTTTRVNTVWLVTVSAAARYSGAVSGAQIVQLQAKVDGSYIATDGEHGVFNANTSGPLRHPVVGRTLATLATAASHTILAALNPTVGNPPAIGAVTITVHQLSG